MSDTEMGEVATLALQTSIKQCETTAKHHCGAQAASWLSRGPTSREHRGTGRFCRWICTAAVYAHCKAGKCGKWRSCLKMCRDQQQKGTSV